jgi:hypothetical protein
LFLQSYFSNISPIWSIFWPIEKHDYNPIQRLSMICCRYHHGRLMVKILHLILLVNNWQNGNNSINILWPRLFQNPPFIDVGSIKDFISYICYIYQCYFGIRHLCLICLCLSRMIDLKNLC